MPNGLEEAVSKGAGKVAAVSAQIKGLRGVFSKLVEQHREAATLIQRARASTDPKKRADLWNKIRKELLSHERAEIQEVYPALRSHGLQEIAEHHGAEAQQLESLIRQLDGVDFASDEWQVTLARVESAVEHHVEEEEKNFFPRAQEAIGEEKARALEKPFSTAKQSILEALR